MTEYIMSAKFNTQNVTKTPVFWCHRLQLNVIYRLNKIVTISSEYKITEMQKMCHMGIIFKNIPF